MVTISVLIMPEWFRNGSNEWYKKVDNPLSSLIPTYDIIKRLNKYHSKLFNTHYTCRKWVTWHILTGKVSKWIVVWQSVSTLLHLEQGLSFSWSYWPPFSTSLVFQLLKPTKRKKWWWWRKSGTPMEFLRLQLPSLSGLKVNKLMLDHHSHWSDDWP